jgi:hypothetical protein
MKKVLFITLIIIPFLSFSQKKTVNLLESKVGPISLKYSMAIDLESQDTLSYVYLGFQNAKYTSITDIKSIFFSKDDIFKQFLKDLKIALEELKKNEKTNLNWDRSPNYQLKIYDFSKNLYVFEGEGTGGYTLLTQKNIQILIEQLSQIVEIGSDEIKKSN